MSDKQNQQEQKVYSMDKWRQDKADGVDTADSSLGPLLEHMRKVREAVPVNNRLKEELRQKLFHLQGGSSPMPVAGSKSSTGRFNRWFVLPGMVIFLMVIIGLILWQQGVLVKKLVTVGGLQEVTRYWVEDEPLRPAVSPDGKNLLVTRGGALLWLDQTGVQYTLLKPGPGEQYFSPAWTPDGKNITLVKKTKEGNEEIIQCQAAFLSNAGGAKVSPEKLAKEKPEVLYRGQEGEKISNLHWSPGGSYLAFISNQPQAAGIVVLLDKAGKLRNLGAGTDLTWSPDGTRLIVERPQKDRPSQLWLAGLDQQGEFLSYGENPVWGPQGYLVFTDIKSQERILTYMPDGTPQFTVQSRVGELRSVYLGENGEKMLRQNKAGQNLAVRSSLLINLNQGRSSTELEWLRRLEMDGVREPRVLLLDEVEQNVSQCFGPAGQSLYLTRESGGMVSLMRVELQERVERQEGQ